MLNPAESLETAERALRELIMAVMFREHGRAWMDVVVETQTLERWRAVREQESSQRSGHVLQGVTDLDYAFLGDLINLVKRKGHWDRLFAPVLGQKAEAFALLDLLQRVRRPVGHNRPLLPFEAELASGIAGYIRNRVTIYLSDQDPEGDYYPLIERIEDNFGNVYSYQAGSQQDFGQHVYSNTTVRVGDRVTLRATGTDPHGRVLRWRLQRPGVGGFEVSEGATAEFEWHVGAKDTGANTGLIVWLTHEGEYHRNPSGNLDYDAFVVFFYRVLPPIQR